MARFLLQCSIPLKNVAVSHKKVSELGIKCHTFSKEAYSSYNFVVHQILWKRKNERADARRWRIKRWFCSRLFIGLWSKCKQMCCAPSLQMISVLAFLWLIVQRQYVIIYIPTTSWAVIMIPFSNHVRAEEVVLFGYCTDGMTVMTRALNRGAPILFLHLYYKGEQLSYMLTIVVLLQLYCIETNYWSQRAFIVKMLKFESLFREFGKKYCCLKSESSFQLAKMGNCKERGDLTLISIPTLASMFFKDFLRN